MKTMRSLTMSAVLAITMAAAPQIGSAHHSTTMFDHSKAMTLKSTVVELRWTNPHVSLLVNGTVKDGGPAADWILEMTSPGNLVRAGGWSRTALKPGDRVTVEFSPHRDGSQRAGALKKVTLDETGQSFTANLRNQEQPGLE
jgi:hypothetical protein